MVEHDTEGVERRSEVNVADGPHILEQQLSDDSTGRGEAFSALWLIRQFVEQLELDDAFWANTFLVTLLLRCVCSLYSALEGRGAGGGGGGAPTSAPTADAHPWYYSSTLLDVLADEASQALPRLTKAQCVDIMHTLAYLSPINLGDWDTCCWADLLQQARTNNLLPLNARLDMCRSVLLRCVASQVA